MTDRQAVVDACPAPSSAPATGCPIVIPTRAKAVPIHRAFEKKAGA